MKTWEILFGLFIATQGIAEQLPSLPAVTSPKLQETTTKASAKENGATPLLVKKQAEDVLADLIESNGDIETLNAPQFLKEAVQKEAAQRTFKQTSAFAESLETSGDLQSAILEWQRIAFHQTGHQHATALLRAGHLYAKTEQPQLAINSYQKFLDTYPNHPKRAETFFRQTLLATGAQQDALLSAMESEFPKSPWSKEARYRQLWEKAQTKNLADNTEVTDARVAILKRRLQHTLHDASSRPLWAAGFSALPGLGHLFLNDWENALLMLPLSLVFFIGIFYALRAKNYGMVAPFMGVVIYASFWSGEQAYTLAQKQIKQDRINAINSWQDLHPQPLENLLKKDR